MTNAEKEAREIASQIIEDYQTGCVGSQAWVDRILRFAREYGPEIARQEAIRNAAGGEYPLLRFLTDGSTPLSPVEDTTPAGWKRIEVPGLTPGAHPVSPWSPPERGKPL